MGQLRDCLEHLNSLQVLDLSNNNLSGKIPQSMGTLVNLRALIRNNNLTGDLPLMDWRKYTTIANLEFASKSLLRKYSLSSLLFETNSPLGPLKE